MEEEKLKKEDLVKYEYYIVKYNEEYIIQCDNLKETYSSCIYLNSLKFQKNGSFRFGDIANSNTCIPIRKATQQEIQWLKACIKANKFVPMPEVEETFYIPML